MLDDRMLRAIQSICKGDTVTDIAKFAEVSRNTIYKWYENKEFKAEVGRCEQESISSTIKSVTSYAPTNVRGLIRLAESARSEKVRLDARLALLNKTMSNATRIEIDNVTDGDKVDSDVLTTCIDDVDTNDVVIE